MIRHMRHGSSPRLMAFQPIRVLDPGESLTGPIGRSPYHSIYERPVAREVFDVDLQQARVKTCLRVEHQVLATLQHHVAEATSLDPRDRVESETVRIVDPPHLA